MENETIEQCAERIVRQEVLCCVRTLVNTLANGFCNVGMNAVPPGKKSAAEQLHTLCEKAFDLSRPVEDWEEAAIQAGWREGSRWGGHGEPETEWTHEKNSNRWCGSAQDLCDVKSLDPYQWEVYEHWAVSNWLADKLSEQGEKVDKDFEGLCVWARTCTGQGIATDGVLQKIARGVLEFRAA